MYKVYNLQNDSIKARYTLQPVNKREKYKYLKHQTSHTGQSVQFTSFDLWFEAGFHCFFKIVHNKMIYL